MPVLSYNVFISSPSDLKFERKMIKERIERMVLDDGTRFFTTLWEDDLPATVTDDPQMEINQLLNEADILVGIFKNRFGSKTSRADSGTQEEIEQAIKQKKPVILYFLKPTTPESVSASEELKKIYSFQRQYQSMGVYHECDTVEDALQKHLRKDLLKNVNIINNCAEEDLRQFQGEITAYFDKACCNIALRERISRIVQDALLGDRYCRREAHLSILSATTNNQRNIFNCIKCFTQNSNDHVRGEAYYCLGLGALNSDYKNYDEDYFVSGLEDTSDFVRACCANTLMHFVPLKANTIMKLRQLDDLYDKSQAGNEQKSLHYYIQLVLYAQKNTIKSGETS